MTLLALWILSSAQLWAAVKNPDTFVYAMVGDVDSLDPHWQYDYISNGAISQLYEPLIAYKGESISEFEPRVAAQVPTRANGLISPDGKTYTFPIRKGIHFHDGSPLTPEDVKYSLMRHMLSDRSGGPAVLLLEPILDRHSTRSDDGKLDPTLYKAADKAIEIRGDRVIVHLPKTFTPFLHVLAEFCHMVPKKWTADHGGWDGTEATWAQFNNAAREGSYLHEHANGSGPFMLERWDRGEKQVIMRRNPAYWGGQPKIARFIFKTVDEFNNRKLMLSAGDADAAFIERQFLPQVTDVPGVIVEDDKPLMEVHNTFVFNFKTDTAGNPYTGSGKLDGDGVPANFFSDRDVREGFAHAFDYDSYIRDGYRGRGKRARGPVLMGMLGHNPDQPVAAYDLREAAQHFKKAWNGQVWEKGFRVTVTYLQGRADRQLACNILKKGLETVNPKFRLDVRPILWSTYLSSWIGHKLPIVSTRWALDFPDPHNCVFPFLHSQGHFGHVSGYRNARMDQLIDQAVRETRPEKRRELYFEIQKIANEDLPVIFTVDTYYARARRAWVKGWDYNPIKYLEVFPIEKAE